MRYLSLVLLLVAAWPAAAADDLRVIKLEQDVRRLEAGVQELSRRVEELSQQLSRSGATAGGTKSSAQASISTTWLAAGNWRRVQPGMSELEVIDVLGLPTSMRTSQDGRVLLYATEIGSSGFLSGSVTLRDGRVTEVAQPVLK
jgi:hypothetical protein